MYEEFGEMRHTCGVEWNEMVRGRGGLVGGGIRVIWWEWEDILLLFEWEGGGRKG